MLTFTNFNIVAYIQNVYTVKPDVATDQHFELDEMWRILLLVVFLDTLMVGYLTLTTSLSGKMTSQS